MKAACHIRPWAERFEEGWRGARQAGYSAVESFCLSQWFDQPRRFRGILSDAGVSLAAMEYGFDGSSERLRAVEIVAIRRLLDFLHEVGASVLVVSGGGLRVRDGDGSRFHLIDEPAASSRLMNLARDAAILGKECAERGVSLCLHPKPGTILSSRDRIEPLLAETDPDHVRLCLDTGDCSLLGCDPLEMVIAHPGRIGHVHWKDLDRFSCRPVPPGRGFLDLSGLLRSLVRAGYAGWVTVEIEQSDDPMSDTAAALELLSGNVEIER